MWQHIHNYSVTILPCTFLLQLFCHAAVVHMSSPRTRVPWLETCCNTCTTILPLFCHAAFFCNYSAMLLQYTYQHQGLGLGLCLCLGLVLGLGLGLGLGHARAVHMAKANSKGKSQGTCNATSEQHMQCTHNVNGAFLWQHLDCLWW